MINFIRLLDRPIAYHRCLVPIARSVEGAVLLSQAIYWQNRMGAGKWWYKTAKEWEEETGLSQRELSRAREGCSRVLKYEVRGLPARGHYMVDIGELERLLATEELGDDHAKTSFADGCKTGLADGCKTGLADVCKTISTETTTETTTERGMAPSEPPPNLDLSMDLSMGRTVKESSPSKLPLSGDLVLSAAIHRPRESNPVPLCPPPILECYPPFAETWACWLKFRREIKKAVTPIGAKQQFAKMAEWGPVKAVESMKISMANGWTGLFEPKDKPANGRNFEKPKSDYDLECGI